jgi:RNA polymerase-binding transcription factor DksA
LVEIDAIKAALNRISEDTFGFCVTCGSEIQEKRLDTLPHTPFCQNCAP